MKLSAYLDLPGNTGTALAKKLGVAHPQVYRWASGTRVPAERVLDIERATNGAVKRHELRPDLYPPEEAAPKPRKPAPAAKAAA